ncbi:MAG: hypothetical protein ABGW78_02330 [Pirellulales bacterium]
MDPHATNKLILLSLASLLVIGCSKSSLDSPFFSPRRAAEDVLATYDSDSNGVLDANEMSTSTIIQPVLQRADRDNNGEVTHAELTNRFATYVADELNMTTFPCRLMLDGRPLAQATVSLMPEAFMGQGYEIATGTTSQSGHTVLSTPSIASSGFSGIYFGVYRLDVSKKNTRGEELVPAHYNSASQIGQEIAPDLTNLERGIVFELTKKAP